METIVFAAFCTLLSAIAVALMVASVERFRENF